MSGSSERVVQIARDWIGTPYRHQSAVKGAGSDCLGLLRGVWRELYGAEPEAVPAYTADWSEPENEERLWQAALRHLKEVHPSAALSSGQVLLFRMRDGAVAKHIGLVAEVADRASFIHAYSGHAVVESPLSAPWLRRVVARFEFP
jgi:NlpC/P60 family putative phage cell wall peptidase